MPTLLRGWIVRVCSGGMFVSVDASVFVGMRMAVFVGMRLRPVWIA